MTRQILQLPAPSAAPSRKDNSGRYILGGLALVVLLFGGLIGWSVTARIDGAVIAPGTVVVDSNRKTVAHLDGGIVGDILVREGERVAAGQRLIRLDDTLERAGLAIIVDQLHTLTARRDRLKAELAEADNIDFDDGLRAAESLKVREILDGQTALFDARRAARDGERQILTQRIAGLRRQIEGLKAQRAARGRQIELIRRELAGVKTLHEKGYSPLTRVLELEREAARIEAQRAEHGTEIARAANAIGEVELQIAQAAQDMREAVTAELRDVQTRILNLTERRVTAETRLARIAITAPQAGVVLGLTAHTVGGVIQAGAPIMQIVPHDDELVLRAQVSPQDVDKLRPGLASTIRFPAFDQQTTPAIMGRLEGVSADRIDDTQRGLSYFAARIRIDEAERAKLGGLTLLPGMPAEVFIQTGERQVLSYLLKPLLDHMARALREG